MIYYVLTYLIYLYVLLITCLFLYKLFLLLRYLTMGTCHKVTVTDHKVIGSKGYSAL